MISVATDKLSSISQHRGVKEAIGKKRGSIMNYLLDVKKKKGAGSK